MTGLPDHDGRNAPVPLTRQADRECDRFEAAWKAGQRPRIEDHLAAVPAPERPALLDELILLEIAYRRLAGDQLRADEWLARFPALDHAWLASVLPAADLSTTHQEHDTPVVERLGNPSRLPDSLAIRLPTRKSLNPDRQAPASLRRRWQLALLVAGLAALGLPWLLGPWNWPTPQDQPTPPATTAATSAKPEPFLANSIGMKLALIPAGTFLMGSPQGEWGRFATEGPRREVAITRAFYIGACEVTQEQFAAVMGYNPSFFTTERGGGPSHPVESVSYPEAVTFCERLSALPAEQRARRVYRLPTEAEWEYACRAGSTTTYYFGDSSAPLDQHAWHSANAGGRTHPVGQLQPNAWGLHDMYGNVWEWCADWFEEHYYETGPSKDPFCNQPGYSRVVRGGGWGPFGDWQWCRSATRGRREPAANPNYHGLRVVLTVPTLSPSQSVR